MKNITLETIQYKVLQDIDDVSPINEKDYEVLSEIRSIIERHGYFDRFGVTLLHKHFEMSQDEILVERTDVENRTLTLSVEPDRSPNEKTIETLWRFKPGPQAVTVCALRCHFNSGHKQVHVKEWR